MSKVTFPILSNTILADRLIIVHDQLTRQREKFQNDAGYLELIRPYGMETITAEEVCRQAAATINGIADLKADRDNWKRRFENEEKHRHELIRRIDELERALETHGHDRG